VIVLTAAQKAITHVLIGARNKLQAEENAFGGFLEINETDRKEMNRISEELLKP